MLYSGIGAGEGDVPFSSVFPSTYSVTEEGMVGVTTPIAATTVLCHFHFCCLVPVVLCMLGQLKNVCGGRTWIRGYIRLRRFSSETLLAGRSESEVL
jgi:hypothetical protein